MTIAILTLCSIAGLQISKPVIASLRKAQAATGAGFGLFNRF